VCVCARARTSSAVCTLLQSASSASAPYAPRHAHLGAGAEGRAGPLWCRWAEAQPAPAPSQPGAPSRGSLAPPHAAAWRPLTRQPGAHRWAARERRPYSFLAPSLFWCADDGEGGRHREIHRARHERRGDRVRPLPGRHPARQEGAAAASAVCVGGGGGGWVRSSRRTHTNTPHTPAHQGPPPPLFPPRQEIGDLDGVVSFSEMAMPLVARLAEKLGLPGNPPSAVSCAGRRGAALVPLAFGAGASGALASCACARCLRRSCPLPGAHPDCSPPTARARFPRSCSPLASLSLPSLQVDQARDKHQTREVMAAAGLPTPRNFLITDPSELEKARAPCPFRRRRAPAVAALVGSLPRSNSSL
jgi:hypothetical protein